MHFGSKFVYNYSDEEEEQYDDEDLHRALDDEGRSSGKKQDTGKKRRQWRMADTNVVCVKFDKLTSAMNMHTGDPIRCSGCGVILSSISVVTEKIWRCEFCNKVNHVDITTEEVPKNDDVTFMLQPSERRVTTTVADKTDLSGDNGSLVVFCVDVSGSMGTESRVPGRVNLCSGQNMYQESRDVTLVSRLEAVKVAVTRQLQEISETRPQTRVALFTFATYVTAVGDGSSESPLTFHGGKTTKEEIKRIGVEQALPRAVAQSKAQLTDKICDLVTQDMTALGPALLMSVAMASKIRGSKVIMCTDGVANVGFGDLSCYRRGGVQYDQATDFYNETGKYASEHGVSISVITFEGTDCRLAELGNVAAMTEGHVNIVDPMKLTEEFGNILIDRTVATNVTATFILHRGLYIRNEENVESKVVKEFGNVSKDTEITFEYGIRRIKKKPTSGTPKQDPAEPPIDPQSSPIKPTTDVSDDTAADLSVPPEQASSTEPVAQPDIPTTSESITSTESSSSSPSVDDLTELPFQLQIVYTDMEGSKAMRVITQTKPITKERTKAESNMKAKVMFAHSTKVNHELALEGRYKEARMNAISNARFMHRNVSHPHVQKKYTDYVAINQDMYTDIQNFEQAEIAQFGRTLSGSDDDSDDEPAQGHVKKCKKRAVIQQRQQMRDDKSSKTIFKNLKQTYVQTDSDSD